MSQTKDNIKGATLRDIAEAITNGSRVKIIKRVEDVNCHCPTCGKMTHGYQRHKRNAMPWVQYCSDDVCHDFSPIDLPEEEASYENLQVDYFGMDAEMMSGFCPNCGSHLAQVWLYRFLNFPKPNMRRGHTMGKEALYALDPMRIVKEFDNCELRLVELEGKVIGSALCYYNALIEHKAFHGWPQWDFRSDAIFFYIDALITNKNFSKTPTMYDMIHNHPDNPKLKKDWEDAEILVRELDRMALRFGAAMAPIPGPQYPKSYLKEE